MTKGGQWVAEGGDPQGDRREHKSTTVWKILLVQRGHFSSVCRGEQASLREKRALLGFSERNGGTLGNQLAGAVLCRSHKDCAQNRRVTGKGRTAGVRKPSPAFKCTIWFFSHRRETHLMIFIRKLKDKMQIHLKVSYKETLCKSHHM